MMRRLALLLVLLVPLSATEAKDTRKKKPKVEKKAMDKLKAADKLIYRPLDHGLTDISFEFEVLTIEGRLNCRYMYRAKSKKLSKREKMTITNVEDRRKRRKFAASLEEYFVLVKWPILIKSFKSQAEGMNVSWVDRRGGMTVLTPLDEEKSKYSRIDFVWNEDGLPREIAWTQMKEDPDEGPYKIEFTATLRWKKQGKFWMLSAQTTNIVGANVVAEYSYAKIRNILLPDEVKRINPFAGTDDLVLKKIRVNQGISDEEFSRW